MGSVTGYSRQIFSSILNEVKVDDSLYLKYKTDLCLSCEFLAAVNALHINVL